MRLDFRQLKPYRDYQQARQVSRRLHILQVLIVLVFVVYAGVFWYLQVVEGEEYRRQAEENRLRRLPDRPVRGVLRDVEGEILATNRPSFAVYLDRERAKDPQREVAALARFLDEPVEPMLERLADAASTPRFVPVLVLPDVGLATAARIEAHRPELPSIDVEVDPKRYYPLGAAAAHVVGYLSESTRKQVAERKLLPGQRVGQTGIELAFDASLRGDAGILLEEVNARGRPLRTVATQKPVRHGTSVRFTIDAAMQRDLAEAFGDEAGAAVFLDPRDGAVRALYSGPSYDPNIFSGRLSRETWSSLVEDPKRPLQNRAVSSVYSPGSTYKIVMAVAGLEEADTLEPGETVFCGGRKKFYGHFRHCHFRGGHGWVGLREALARSCNIYFYTLGQRLGIEKIEAWSRRFGLGDSTGVGLGTEAPGLVPSDEWKRRERGEPWYPGETISVAIGQGPLLVSPMQMAVVAAAIANGGQRISPYFEVGLGSAKPPEPMDISEQTLEVVRNGLIDVVESNHGTARRARVKGIEVAGKTGTAQVVALDAEDDPGDHAWFVGFAPVEDPRLAFAIIVEHSGHGGAVAAPIARAVIEGELERHPKERDEEDSPSSSVASLRGAP